MVQDQRGDAQAGVRLCRVEEGLYIEMGNWTEGLNPNIRRSAWQPGPDASSCTRKKTLKSCKIQKKTCKIQKKTTLICLIEHFD